MNGTPAQRALLYNDVYGNLQTAVDGIWCDKWQPGNVLTESFLLWNWHCVKTEINCEAEPFVTTRAGRFENCLKVTINTSGFGNGLEEYVQRRWPQSDLDMIAGTLPTYIDRQPFNVYYMSVSGHSGYTKAGNAMTAKNWDKVKDLPYSDMIKGYLAANIELENALTHLVTELENKGIADDTVICISTDHFPYGLDYNAKLGDMPYLSELYGYNVTNLIERDHSRLIIWSGCLEKMDPIIVDSPTFGLDIVPTLSNLFGTEFDSRLLPGRDALSDAEALVFNMNYDWKTDLGTYYSSKGKFVPNDENAEIPDGYVNRIKTIVRNKIRYCSNCLTYDYYNYHFGN